MLDRNK